MTDDELWAAIAANGPLTTYASFDPLLVDDVLQAERQTAQYDRRRTFVATYAWSVPTREAVEAIADFVAGREVLEVCAGSGLWARVLASAGVSIVATDGVEARDAWHPVETLDAVSAVLRYIDRAVLMLVWPPMNDPCAHEALRSFTGDAVVYVGDVRFTADAAFQSALRESWRLVREVPVPSWPGTYDAVHLYVRGPGDGLRMGSG